MNRKSANFVAAVVVAVGLTTTAAALHGRLSNRWSPAPSNAAALEFLTRLPRTLGEWQLSEDQPLTAAAVEILQCAGYVNRIYTHRRTGDWVTVTLLAGPSGPMTVHTPEICMTTRDFVSLGEPDRVEFTTGNSTARFYRSAFRSTTPGQPSVEVFYGWSEQGRWDAPDAPRFAYGGAPILLKLQVASTFSPDVASGNDGLAGRFLQELLAELSSEFAKSTTDSPLGSIP
jgi:hypothetical protein